MIGRACVGSSTSTRRHECASSISSSRTFAKTGNPNSGRLPVWPKWSYLRRRIAPTVLRPLLRTRKAADRKLTRAPIPERPGLQHRPESFHHGLLADHLFHFHRPDAICDASRDRRQDNPPCPARYWGHKLMRTFWVLALTHDH